ncbi:hypothetical protein KFU94_29660 [Chloroflexi bacterium TSY]|nr:hypothetical protein [Chloroflexi bacterium TSY]
MADAGFNRWPFCQPHEIQKSRKSFPVVDGIAAGQLVSQRADQLTGCNADKLLFRVEKHYLNIYRITQSSILLELNSVTPRSSNSSTK